MIDKIYRNLQQHLDEVTIGFPSTESGIEIRLLKQLFTSEEAEIALYLRFSWKDLEPLETIFNRIKPEMYSIEELEPILDRMANKGAIMALKVNEIKTYGNANFVVGMTEYQVNKLTKRFYKGYIKYLYEAYIKEISKTSIPQIRLIPVEQKIETSGDILPYDNIKEIMDKSDGPYMVTNCLCKQGRDLLKNDCQVTLRREVCISFGYCAQRYIDQGWGREISKEEAISILNKNDDENLIHQVNNAQHPDYICSCCSCCCEGLRILKSLPNPGQLTKSNYYSRIDSALCIGCGLCVESCQMDAISQKGDAYSIIRKRCIGCGNCINQCNSNAIQLKTKRKPYIPPLTGDDLYKSIIETRKNLQK